MVMYTSMIILFVIQWLTEEFLGYLNDWEQCVNERQGYTKSQKNMMMLSQETLLGLRITSEFGMHACMYLHLSRSLACSTAKSFVDLVDYVFSLPEVTLLLSQRLCQDPLEKFFGCQRQRGGTNENPTVAEFCKNTQALRVVNSLCRDTVRGNCRGNKHGHNTVEEENLQPLPKRRRIRK